MTETDSRQLPPQYAPSEVEARRYEHWEAAGLMRADAKAVSPSAPAFAIVIPPPNVTGSLHIGHALDHTLMDALVRRRRMQGYTALWLPGMDHAGIATQNVVERELAKEGLSRHDLGREKFAERVWQWKAESGGKILGQMRRLGDSVDWDRERFTMDEGLSRAVQTIFKRLFDDGLIYRAERIINWCPRCLTALSDIEVDHTEDEGELVSIRYGDGDDSIVVATTRVETMLGDTAVAVHPDDSRYSHLVGREIELPLSGRRIPVVADPHVDPEFGTGAVKVTPAHDPDDFEIGRRHELPSLMIMDERGVITAHGPFVGLDRFEARPAVRRRCGKRAGSSPSGGPTCTRSGTAAGAARPSSRGCRCSGSSRSARWPRRPATRSGTAGWPSTRPRWPAGTSTGSTTCTTGASAASSGGGTGSRSGTRPAARPSASARTRTRRARAGPRTATCWTPGSPRRCGRSPPWAGRTTPPTCARSTRPACWSPATTSCSSGSSG